MPSRKPSEDRSTADELDLLADDHPAGASDAAGPAVELVSGRPSSLTSTTTDVLHRRLRAVTVLLLGVFAMVFVWTLFTEGLDQLASSQVYRDVGVVRLVFLGVVLYVLLAQPERSQPFVRGVEYTLFGVLTLMWLYSRYQSIIAIAGSGDVAALQLDGRTSMIGLFLLMVVYGIFIPHRWQETARVVVTMALAPTLALVILEAREPELAGQIAPALSWGFVSTNVLIVLVGAVLATYTSYVLYHLRKEVHDARQYGQYQLVSKLGSGGMGDVYLAEHVLMKRPCALKLIRSQASADPTAIARFEREVKTTSGLTHPHTIEIYDYGHTDDGTFYYVMEYLPGLSLADLLERYGPLPPARVVYLLRQACSALSEAHAAGLIHRDLKPGNLYISERGGLCDFVKVLDFGLVKLLRASSAAQLTADHVVSGTPTYMAPEQATGERTLDARSDLYALGAIAYHMLAGRPPFQGDNALKVMMAHVRDTPAALGTLRQDIPDDLQQIVMRCLEKSPEDRFESAGQLEQELAACSLANQWSAQEAAVWWHEVCFATEKS